MADDRPVEIGILCFPGFQATTVHGLTDLFTYAGHFSLDHEANPQPAVRVSCAGASRDRLPPLRISHWRQHPENHALERIFDSHPGPPGKPTAVIVPASQRAPMEQGCAPACLEWIKARHREGAVVAAVCGGVFLLAETGLLAGRRVTTHWMFAEELARRSPEVLIEPERLVIDDGDIITAGGVLAWADLGLSLVERLLGPTVMLTTARFMLFDPSGREQRFYSGFAPRLQHGDRAILAVQHWMQTQTAKIVTVSALAERARLGERTFLRRFSSATGMKPMEYHQHLRVARARELLEFTSDTVDQIAAAVGYEISGGFRRTFKRVMGLSPAEYRRRFGRPRVQRSA